MVRAFQRPLLHILAVVSFSVSAMGAEPGSGWHQFRGTNNAGVETECNVPLPWQESDVAWKLDLPGIGNSSPVVFGEHIYLMSADPQSAERYLLAYDLKTGEEVWRETHASSPHHLHKRSSYASSTPCVGDKAVYFSWASPDKTVLRALKHDGSLLWERDDIGTYISQHGYGASPALFGNTVILFVSQQAEQMPAGAAPGQSRVFAFDATTGVTLWQTDTTTTRACYGIPALFKDNSGKDALLFANTGDGLFALDLATGEKLWNNKVFAMRSCSSPIIVDGMGIGTEGSGGGGNQLFAVDLSGTHDVKFKISRAAPYVPTPVAKGQHLFLWDDSGIVTCLELPSGKVSLTKRVGGNVSSSPVIAGDKLVGIAEDGTVTILAADATLEKLGSVKLDDTTRATPMVAKNYILFRTNSKLICVGKP